MYIVSKHNDGIFAHANRILKTNGIRGFQKGLLLGYANSINGTITFTMYNVLKDVLNKPQFTEITNDHTKTIVCSVMSKVFAYLLTFPIFACRIQHQIQQKSITTALKTVFSTPSKMYSGLAPTLLIAIPKNTIMFVLKENLLENKN